MCVCMCVVDDLSPSPLQNHLLCVRTVVVITWFFWPCPPELPVGSRDGKSNLGPPRSPQARSMTLLATPTPATGLAVPPPRPQPPLTTSVGASARVSLGEQRCWGRGAGVARAG